MSRDRTISLIEKLRFAGAKPSPPAQAEELRTLENWVEAHFPGRLPEEYLDLLRASDGVELGSERLLSVRAAREAMNQFRLEVCTADGAVRLDYGPAFVFYELDGLGYHALEPTRDRCRVVLRAEGECHRVADDFADWLSRWEQGGFRAGDITGDLPSPPAALPAELLPLQTIADAWPSTRAERLDDDLGRLRTNELRDLRDTLRSAESALHATTHSWRYLLLVLDGADAHLARRSNSAPTTSGDIDSALASIDENDTDSF